MVLCTGEVETGGQRQGCIRRGLLCVAKDFILWSMMMILHFRKMPPTGVVEVGSRERHRDWCSHPGEVDGGGLCEGSRSGRKGRGTARWVRDLKSVGFGYQGSEDIALKGGKGKMVPELSVSG